jgi:hypothetical protein
LVVGLLTSSNHRFLSLIHWSDFRGPPQSEVVLGLPDGEIMEGSIPNNKMKLVEAWIEIHKEDLLANWELAVNGQEVFKIEPLK